MTVNGVGEPAIPQGRGEVLVTWVEAAPGEQRMRIAPAGPAVLIALPLLALIEAGESPWASLSEAGHPSESDPYGYSGSLLRIDAGDRTVTYRVGGYHPAQRCYLADLHGELPRPAITGADPAVPG